VPSPRSCARAMLARWIPRCSFYAGAVRRSALAAVAVQLLWLNLVTNGIQDVALAFAPDEGHESQQRPRLPQEPIFNRLMVERVVLSALVMGSVTFSGVSAAVECGYGSCFAQEQYAPAAGVVREPSGLQLPTRGLVDLCAHSATQSAALVWYPDSLGSTHSGNGDSRSARHPRPAAGQRGTFAAFAGLGTPAARRHESVQETMDPMGCARGPCQWLTRAAPVCPPAAPDRSIWRWLSCMPHRGERDRNWRAWLARKRVTR